jgi:LysR family nitrogen assimilation transcriptional regulator
LGFAALTPTYNARVNLKQLQYFVSVAEHGSFSKAALTLQIAQPALSRQVRLLEADLRVNLLQRTGRGAVLTEAGKRLFEHSIGILQLVTRAEDDLSATRDVPSGRIVVALPPSMGRLLTVPLVEAFRRQLPKARLTVVEGLSTHIGEWIATGRVDLGLVHNPEGQSAIETTPVYDEPLCLVGPAPSRRVANGRERGPGRKAAVLPAPRAGSPVRFADLPSFPLVVPERTHAIRKLLETSAALAGLKLQVALEISSVHSILDLVRAGYGFAVLARSAVLASGEPQAFEVRPLAEPSLTSMLCLAFSAHKPATPLARHAMRMLRELVASQVAATDEPPVGRRARAPRGRNAGRPVVDGAARGRGRRRPPAV